MYCYMKFILVFSFLFNQFLYAAAPKRTIDFDWQRTFGAVKLNRDQKEDNMLQNLASWKRNNRKKRYSFYQNKITQHAGYSVATEEFINSDQDMLEYGQTSQVDEQDTCGEYFSFNEQPDETYESPQEHLKEDCQKRALRVHFSNKVQIILS